MLNSILAVFIGLVTGGVASLSASCAWCALQLPSRVQDRFRALSPFSCAWAIAVGLLLSALRMGLGFSLGLPTWTACATFLFGGMFVGMLASALGEVLDVIPVLAHRLHLNNISRGTAFAVAFGKTIGAVIACLAVTFS